MMVIDKFLAEREVQGQPIRVGMIGAGFEGRGVALQLVARRAPGLRLVAIANRHLEGARHAYSQAGAEDAVAVESPTALLQAIAEERYAVTEDATLLTDCPQIDVILEITGSVDYAAGMVLRAIEHGKHVVMMDAELDGTVGPILKVYADRAGVCLTQSDGDQPGVIANLYRFVRSIGAEPVLVGNIKGLHDPYRNPETQIEFARRTRQRPPMVASYADGTKISYEMAVSANAFGLSVARRGMYGPTVPMGTEVRESPGWYPPEALEIPGGIVDYVVQAEPAPGVFVIARYDHPVQREYLKYYKLGDGPYYVFYRPYHLCHFEAHHSIARAALFDDATMAPIGGPRVEVITTAKRDLVPGEVLDGFGGFLSYGLAENADVVARDRLLPMGVADDCQIKRAVPKDQVLTYDDVELPSGRLIERLRREQAEYFHMPYGGI
ncbi:MAG: NAD(P)H-dependent oxidoreductase [Acidithiobacillus sp.]